jgi:hypothetical protein
LRNLFAYAQFVHILCLLILLFDFLPLASGFFPLFTDAMYQNLGYPHASSLLGGLAFIFSILPFLLMAYGPRIRKKSKVARQIAWQQDKRAAEAVRNIEEKEKDSKSGNV